MAGPRAQKRELPSDNESLVERTLIMPALFAAMEESESPNEGDKN